VTAPQRTLSSTRKGKAPASARILLSTVAMGALALYATKPVAQWFDAPVRVEQAAMQRDIIPAPPAVYWANAVRALRSAPRVMESGPEDPPPRY